ncbi:hypothetical protein Tco_1270994, partial [Tanacetum coccineum]
DYEEPYDVGSPGVFVYGYDGLPMYLCTPEYLALSDEEVPMEDQPYAAANSLIALSPGYIVDSDPEDGPTDYSADGGDDDDDDESSGDDVDDEDVEEASKEDGDEEEEHLALADSNAVASLVVDPVPSVEETEPFETDESAATPPPPPAYRTTARMSIRAQTPIPFSSEAEVNKLLAIPTEPVMYVFQIIYEMDVLCHVNVISKFTIYLSCAVISLYLLCICHVAVMIV